MTIYHARTMVGRVRTDRERSGHVAHAIAGDDPGSSYRPALCGAAPGRRGNGWALYESPLVTCPKCLAKLAKLAVQP